MARNECKKQTRIPHCDRDFTEKWRKRRSRRSKTISNKEQNVRHFDTLRPVRTYPLQTFWFRILIFCLIMFPLHVKIWFFFFLPLRAVSFSMISPLGPLSVSILHWFMSNTSISHYDDKVEKNECTNRCCAGNQHIHTRMQTAVRQNPKKFQ